MEKCTRAHNHLFIGATCDVFHCTGWVKKESLLRPIIAIQIIPTNFQFFGINIHHKIELGDIG